MVPPRPTHGETTPVTVTPPVGVSFEIAAVPLATAGVVGAPATPVTKNWVLPTPE